MRAWRERVHVVPKEKMKKTQNKKIGREHANTRNKLAVYSAIFAVAIVLSMTATALKSFANVSKEERIKREISALQADISALQAEYFAFKGTVSKKMASEFGLQAPESPVVYVEGGLSGKVSLANEI